jgi:hypothetical protein
VYVIVTGPLPVPVTIPEDEPMVATATLPLAHVPPATALFNVIEDE